MQININNKRNINETNEIKQKQKKNKKLKYNKCEIACYTVNSQIFGVWHSRSHKEYEKKKKHTATNSPASK